MAALLPGCFSELGGLAKRVYNSKDAGRWVASEQIAATVRFLCSDEAASINGAAIPIYGRA